MSENNRKKNLYGKVEALRNSLGISESDYPINAIDLCVDKECAIVEKISFKTTGLRGMSCMANESNEKDIILLNSNQNSEELSFTCGHELMHLLLHRNAKVQSFSSFEKTMPNQNQFYEWQANEGSAELHVPYQQLLRKIKKAYPTLLSWHDFYSFKSKLAEDYDVSSSVINFRFESLKYEIDQYLNDVKAEDIEFMSVTKQKECGINITSLNDMENQYLNKENESFKKIHNRTLNVGNIDIYNESQKNPPLPVAPGKNGHYQQG